MQKLKPIYSTLPTVIMVEQILTFYYNVTNDGLSLDSFRRKIDENDLKI